VLVFLQDAQVGSSDECLYGEFSVFVAMQRLWHWYDQGGAAGQLGHNRKVRNCQVCSGAEGKVLQLPLLVAPGDTFSCPSSETFWFTIIIDVMPVCALPRQL
jgi:hypothetical protein